LFSTENTPKINQKKAFTGTHVYKFVKHLWESDDGRFRVQTRYLDFADRKQQASMPALAGIG
jgi:hypothetical protein